VPQPGKDKAATGIKSEKAEKELDMCHSVIVNYNTEVGLTVTAQNAMLGTLNPLSKQA
jgi:hypothetical protein